MVKSHKIIISLILGFIWGFYCLFLIFGLDLESSNVSSLSTFEKITAFPLVIADPLLKILTSNGSAEIEKLSQQIGLVLIFGLPQL